MEKESFALQAGMDRVAMQQITHSLERAIVRPRRGNEFSDKLSNVKFLAESFELHMERQFAFEELDGYMVGVRRLHPEFTDKVGGLKETHVQLRKMVRKLVLRLEHAPPTEFAIFEAICGKLQDSIGWFRKHNRQEHELLIEALFRDTGGEG